MLSYKCIKWSTDTEQSMKIETKESLILELLVVCIPCIVLNAFDSNFDLCLLDSEGECSDKGSQGSSGSNEFSSASALNDLGDLGVRKELDGGDVGGDVVT